MELLCVVLCVMEGDAVEDDEPLMLPDTDEELVEVGVTLLLLVGASVGGIGGAEGVCVGVGETVGVSVDVKEVAVTVDAAVRVAVGVSPTTGAGSSDVVAEGVAIAEADDVRERSGDREGRDDADCVFVGFGDCVTESEGDAVSVG